MQEIKKINLSLVLNDVARFMTSKIDISEINETKYISTENMISNKGGITIANSLPNSKSVREYLPEDILINNIRPYFKKIWYSDMIGGCSSDVFVIRSKENYDSKFLYYVLSSDDFFSYVMANAKGTKMPRGDKKAIQNYEVPNFSIDEQKKISKVLDGFDKKIAINKKINKNLEEIAQSFLNENFFIFSKYSEDQLMDTDIGKIPINWKIYKLNELFNHIKPGTNYQPKRVEKGIPFLNVKNINSGFIDLSDVKYISLEDFKKVHKTWMPEENDILISRIGTLGLTTIIDKDDLPLAVHYNFINIKSNRLPYQFIYFLFKSNNFQRKYHTIKKYSVQEYVTIDDFSEIEIALHNNLNELQSQFKLFVNLFDKIQENILEIKKLQKLRDILLPKLMSGEIDVSQINCDLELKYNYMKYLFNQIHTPMSNSVV